jgi:hypothetical protein
MKHQKLRLGCAVVGSMGFWFREQGLFGYSQSEFKNQQSSIVNPIGGVVRDGLTIEE